MGSSRDWAANGATLRVHTPATAGTAGTTLDIPVIVRIDTPIEIDYYRAGGILPYVLAQILREQG